MKCTSLCYSLLLIILFSSCGVNKKIEGLWQIEKVAMGDQEVTPIAKWTRINKDHSHESGNGWNQHSVGNWEYDSKEKEITLLNTNGIVDEYGGFTILAIKNGKMLWSRTEEGEKVLIHLTRVENIPKSPANQLLGVWKLKSGTENNSEKLVSYLFMRWDQILVKKQGGEKKKYGVYKPHGHKNELEIIYYEAPLRQEKWTYTFVGEDTLFLKKDKEGKMIELEYERINYIPR